MARKYSAIYRAALLVLTSMGYTAASLLACASVMLTASPGAGSDIPHAGLQARTQIADDTSHCTSYYVPGVATGLRALCCNAPRSILRAYSNVTVTVNGTVPL